MTDGAPDRTARIIGRQIVYDGWSRISDLLLHMPNGAIEKRLLEDHGSAAAVLLYDPARRVALMIRQPRAPVIEMGEAMLLEVVAGRLDDKSGEDTARAEAWEEAGVRIGVLEHIATLWTMPAISTERIALYIGRYAIEDRLGAGGGAEEENECITIEEVPLARLRLMMAAGELPDGKSFTLVQALMLRQPELFD